MQNKIKQQKKNNKNREIKTQNKVRFQFVTIFLIRNVEPNFHFFFIFIGFYLSISLILYILFKLNGSFQLQILFPFYKKKK